MVKVGALFVAMAVQLEGAKCTFYSELQTLLFIAEKRQLSKISSPRNHKSMESEPGTAFSPFQDQWEWI